MLVVHGVVSTVMSPQIVKHMVNEHVLYVVEGVEGGTADDRMVALDPDYVVS